MNKLNQDPEILSDCVALVKNVATNPEYVSAIAFEPRMASELYNVRSHKDLPKSLRHNATLALRAIKENAQAVPEVGEHISWLLEEDLEDHKKGRPQQEQPPSGMDQPTRRDSEWFVLEVPELQQYNNNIELEIQKHCRGVLSIRKQNQDSLVITCLQRFKKSQVLKECTDLLFQKRLLARPKSESPVRLQQVDGMEEQPSSPEPGYSYNVLDDSDKSPLLSPPAGQQGSPSKKRFDQHGGGDCTAAQHSEGCGRDPKQHQACAWRLQEPQERGPVSQH
eukprot:TRINITY_DN4655_c0_g1_i1.p1 TRINITY_DN4655_c0_g1~~TRINITY_DN4655_c0_g1_i1.p1  ORF type:complete len:279 (+),score=75.64 TRINITY_DN4655_c0_g1_i1:178-1014(+)